MNSELIESTINILQNEFVKSIYETALMIGISFSLSLIFCLTLGFILYLTSGKTFFEKKVLPLILPFPKNFNKGAQLNNLRKSV